MRTGLAICLLGLTLVLPAGQARAESALYLPALVADVPPTLDGQLESYAGEWLNASAVHLGFGDGGSTGIVALAAADQDYLYLAFVGRFEMSSAGDYIGAYFDQGINGGNADGMLTGDADLRGEYAFRLRFDGSTVAVQEYSYNGNWVQNLTAPAAEGYCSALDTVNNQCEIAIPLTFAAASDQGAYLDVETSDRISMLLVVGSASSESAAAGTNEMSYDPSAGVGWTIMSLNLPGPLMGFVDSNGAVPMIDAQIASDPAWNRASYLRLPLISESNDRLTANIYSTENVLTEKFYLAVNIFTANGTGELRLAFDEGEGGGSRDGRYSSGDENEIIIFSDGSAYDLYYDGAAFAGDITASVTAAVVYDESEITYEIELPRNSADSFDLNLAAGGITAIDFQFTDGDGTIFRPQTGATAPVETDAGLRVFGGIPAYSAAPYVNVAAPVTDQLIGGTAAFSVYAADYFAATAGISKVMAQVLSRSTYESRYNLAYTASGSAGQWQVQFPSFVVGDGDYLLRLLAEGSAGKTAYYIPFKIDNLPPWISELTLDPNPAQTGDFVAIELIASEDLAQPPVLLVFAEQATVVQQSSSVFEYSFTVPGDWSDGSYPISAEMIDEAGNYATRQAAVSLIVDSQQPQLIGELDVEPLLAKAGDEISITFTLSETPVTAPTVLLDGNACELTQQTAEYFIYHYTVNGTENTGYVTISVEAQDAVGQTSTFTNNELYLDFIAPGFLSVAVEPNVLESGNMGIITFTATERLAAAPVVMLFEDYATLRLNQGNGYTFTTTVPEGLQPGTYQLSISGSDLAGNQGIVENAFPVQVTDGSGTEYLPECDIQDYLDDGECNDSSAVEEDEGNRLNGGIFGCSYVPGQDGGDRFPGAVLFVLFYLLAGILLKNYRVRRGEGRVANQK